MTKQDPDLQRIDCNCNDCIFLDRDFQRYREKVQKDRDWVAWKVKHHRRKLLKQATKAFNKGEWNKYRSLLKKRKKVDTTPLNKPDSNYGTCKKHGHQLEFLPNTFQLETQECFVHRKDRKVLSLAVEAVEGDHPTYEVISSKSVKNDIQTIKTLCFYGYAKIIEEKEGETLFSITQAGYDHYLDIKSILDEYEKNKKSER